MRVEGAILDFDRYKGSGFIQYRMNSRIYFQVGDIQNYVAGRVRKGQKVSFETERNRFGMRAREVYLVLKPREEAIFFPQAIDEGRIDPLYSQGSAEDLLEDDKVSPTDKEAPQDFVAFALIDGKIKLVSLTRDGKYTFLDEQQNRHGILYVGISLARSLREAIEEFEYLINDPAAKEQAFQDFFQRNPDFILSDDYKQAHPHVVLSRDGENSLIPDFVLEPFDQSSLCDILELKLPSSEVFVLKKNRARYSAAVYEAAAQLREYSRFFDEERNRKGFQRNYPGLRAFRPRMFVIIGRRGQEDPLLRRLIQADHPDLFLRTYDEVLARMKWKMNAMKAMGA